MALSNEHTRDTGTNMLLQLYAKLADSRRWLTLILAIVAMGIYANTLTNGYVLDDMAVITHNTYVQKGLAGIPEILTTPSLSGFSERPVYDTAAINDIYRPISLSMFAAEHQFFGNTPVAGHLFNVLLFAGCVVLLFLFFAELLSTKQFAPAFLAALLFAVHPIHTEVVANIKSRDELLCFFFGFSALYLAMRYMTKGTWYVLATALVCYFLSLLSKETSISFVAIVPLLCLWYASPNKKRAVMLTVAMLAVAALYLGIRFYILASHNANHPGLIDFMENPLTGAPDVASRIATAIEVMGRYLQLLFLPYPLSCDYTFATIPFVDFGHISVWAVVFIYLALAGVGIYRLLKIHRDIVAFGLLFYLLSIAIFSNLFFLTGAIMAERFLFFPSVGFCLIVATLLTRLAARWGVRGSLLILTLPVIVTLSGMTLSRNTDWESNYTLFSADVKKQPENARLQHAMAFELTSSRLQTAASDAEKRELLQQGIECYRRSLSIYPAQSKVHTDLGNLFASLGQTDSAEVHMLQAAALKPGDPVILSMLGGIYFGRGQYEKTLSICRAALLKAPRNTTVMNNMGMCYLQMGAYDSVVNICAKVLELEPGNELAAANMASAKSKNASR
jgi:protein O-mannosyl-transferase